MALLQIAEPGQFAAPHQHKLAAGIDLGTTNSLVASVLSGMAVTLPDAAGRHLLPSVVRYAAEGVVVGDEAKLAAVEDPLNTVQSVKRLMGRGLADLKTLGSTLPYDIAYREVGEGREPGAVSLDGSGAVPRIRTRSGEVTPVEVSAEILKTLARRAEQSLGGELTGVVITVPAYFDDAQRQATKDAARLAGLNVFRLLNEPTAAAVAYGLDQRAEGVHAVYDLGGGTFDISILRLHRGVFEVMSTGGDSALGGDDFDRALAQWIMAQAGLGEDLDPVMQLRLTRLATGIKEQLSSVESAEIHLELPNGGRWQGSIDRETFNGLIDPLIAKTLAACRRALRDAGVTAEEIEDVVMVGGSTRVPRVRERVKELFRAEPRVDVDPDRVVAIGAAIQADVLAGNKPDEEMLLLDVISLSLGMETMGGLVERIVPRNTTIPVARAQEFTTFKDGQTALALHVVQGERDLVSDCRSLARFELRGIPPMVAGAARIRVTFEVDADGLLNVTALEETSGVKAGVVVKPSYGLSDSEVERMLRDSIAHAEDDMAARRLREEQVEAERVTEALRAALAQDGDQLLDAGERAGIEQALKHLVETAASQNHLSIKRAREALEKVCEPYVERRMNTSVRQAMAGHKLDEFES
ncbi:MAG: Fe-S protein assembly chaperone HscA [Gammaproteobacteria bacterium RIFOXYA12_FULL_61_12]|nr:MAG: Fe-S protein assembly chaperone HscA [Gammaproteobacteria bacterium RIFOXYD12_FULL_61_37]OGT93948.1 MAG: Fe-S protein assembly chaperone HscA [Gammaproteobacteria bacterium RIFOXYA12_FULL_61_12]